MIETLAIEIGNAICHNLLFMIDVLLEMFEIPNN